MTLEEKENIKKKIEEELEILEESIEELENLNKPIVSDCSLGRITRTGAIYDQSLHRANLSAALQKSSQLKKKLEEIESDDFGRCAICGGEIGFNRLFALPQSQVCISCAKKR